jgi:hypothetical protein
MEEAGPALCHDVIRNISRSSHQSHLRPPLMLLSPPPTLTRNSIPKLTGTRHAFSTSTRYARTRTHPGPLLVVPSACVAIPRLPHAVSRCYSNGIGGGGGGPPKGGFPSFSLGPQHQKGEALKEYVSRGFCSAAFSGLLNVSPFVERGFDGTGEGGET